MATLSTCNTLNSFTNAGEWGPPTALAFAWGEAESTVGTRATGYRRCIVECQTTRMSELSRVVPDEFRFAQLVKHWHIERGITSSLSEMVLCPSYLEIIGMGEKALSLILAQIRYEGDDPDHWFTALEAITGEDPVPEDAYGDTVKMAEVWLSWAEENNVW